MNSQVILTAKTHRAKNRLRELAARVPAWTGRWEVTAERRCVAFSPGVAGPWLMVEPEGASEQDRDVYARWVHEHSDKDFSVTAAGTISA